MNHIKKFESFSMGNKEDNPWEDIVRKLGESQSSGWYGETLEESTDCVRLENGWLSDIEQIESLDTNEILSKIEENRFDLWENDLENTFECILTDDLYDDNEELITQYNGWYEDIVNLSKND